MTRRSLRLKRIDPWSLLKFGFVVNLSLLAIFLLGFGVLWFFVGQLGLVEKVCNVAGEVGFAECGVNGGNLFRALLLLGLLGAVVQTGVLVFLAFLHNLIADLVGGLTFTVVDDSPPLMRRRQRVDSGAGRTDEPEPDPPSRPTRPRPEPAGTASSGRPGAGRSKPPRVASARARSTTPAGPAPDGADGTEQAVAHERSDGPTSPLRTGGGAEGRKGPGPGASELEDIPVEDDLFGSYPGQGR